MELGGEEAALKDSPFAEVRHFLFAVIPGIPSSPFDISLSGVSQEGRQEKKGFFEHRVHSNGMAPSI